MGSESRYGLSLPTWLDGIGGPAGKAHRGVSISSHPAHCGAVLASRIESRCGGGPVCTNARISRPKPGHHLSPQTRSWGKHPLRPFPAPPNRRVGRSALCHLGRRGPGCSVMPDWARSPCLAQESTTQCVRDELATDQADVLCSASQPWRWACAP